MNGQRALPRSFTAVRNVAVMAVVGENRAQNVAEPGCQDSHSHHHKPSPPYLTQEEPMAECWGCIDLDDPADPPEVRVEGWMAVPGCPAHDPDGTPIFSDSVHSIHKEKT